MLLVKSQWSRLKGMQDYVMGFINKEVDTALHFLLATMSDESPEEEEKLTQKQKLQQKSKVQILTDTVQKSEMDLVKELKANISAQDQKTIQAVGDAFQAEEKEDAAA